MTYLSFHLWFILPPILVLAVLQRRPLGGAPRGLALRALGLIVLAAFVYTSLWDNYLIYRGVWFYGPDRVLGTVGYVPVEEYAFFMLQPLLTGLFYFLLRSLDIPSRREDTISNGGNVAAVTLPFCTTVLCAGLLLWGPDNTLYLALILAWCCPVMAVLMWLGLRKIWPERKRLALGIAVPTVYLWIADRVALGDGVWSISEQYSLGFDPFGLPIEEAVFFFVTNWMVVQGVAMLLPDNPATT